MASPTFGCTEIPVVIKWVDAGQYSYIGTRIQNLRMNIHLGTHACPKLLFWFTVTVGVTASPESSTIRKKLLYFVIQARLLVNNENDTPCLSLETPNSDCSPDTSAAIREAGICSDYASVSRICFQLHNHGTVFMPPTEKHAFTPASDNVLQLLASMESLSQAKQFWVYTSLEESLLTNIWKRIDRIRKGTFTGDFTTQSVYKHGMVCDKWTNFNQFVRQENPAKHKSNIHSVKHNSDAPPLYTSECQGAGLEHKDSDRLYESSRVSGKDLSSHDLDQQLVDTETDEELSVGRKRKYNKISSDAILGNLKNVNSASMLNSDKSCLDRQTSRVRFAKPRSEIPGYLEKQLAAFIRWVLEIDLYLEKDCEQVFSDLGGAVSCGDITKFNEIKTDCMANIYITYAKRGSKWVLRNTI
ncbi:uncharacterized protein Bfra_011798 [Botrytis fragariae]|uniref:Uncharacterized protein n=1 Tax=Botrytis fragariae TaxID=1964551 RepID=A0A8H6AL42_9HELO|nr:uncharacterized protein Bfra_011798 [Botrytis fragariae]KAF5869255.1 hypothetical protein Bfra_011798 [Botrytis fragariae]